MDGERLTAIPFTLGQVWTPEILAIEMARRLLPFANQESVILEPSCGPGALLAAIEDEGVPHRKVLAFEIDHKIQVLGGETLANKKLELCREDFLESKLVEDNSIDLALLNPPYIRHELIPEDCKVSMAQRIKLLDPHHVFDKKSNYFTYFLFEIALKLKPGGVMVALVYNSLSHTSYGKRTMSLLSKLGHVLDRKPLSGPFHDALVDAEILVWQKYSENEPHIANAPKSSITSLPGFVAIKELAETQRGTAFPLRSVYTGTSQWLIENGQPLVSKVSSLDTVASTANTKGISQAANIDELELARHFKELGYAPATLRLPKPITGQILFNYYFREHPRHIWNGESFLASDNFYCLKTRTGVDPLLLWLTLNSSVTITNLSKSSRPQGNGLQKLQLFEYSEVKTPDVRLIKNHDARYLRRFAQRLIKGNTSKVELTSIVDSMLGVKRGEEFFGEITRL